MFSLFSPSAHLRLRNPFRCGECPAAAADAAGGSALRPCAQAGPRAARNEADVAGSADRGAAAAAEEPSGAAEGAAEAEAEDRTTRRARETFCWLLKASRATAATAARASSSRTSTCHQEKPSAMPSASAAPTRPARRSHGEPPASAASDGMAGGRREKVGGGGREREREREKGKKTSGKRFSVFRYS